MKRSTISTLSKILLESSEARLNITAACPDVSICCGCAAILGSIPAAALENLPVGRKVIQ